MADIFVTSVADAVLAGLAPEVKTKVVEFLRSRMPGFAETHGATSLPGLDGEYWVVKPVSGGPTLVVTTKADSPEEYVLAAVLNPEVGISGEGHEPTKAAEIGAKVFEAQVVADDSSANVT